MSSLDTEPQILTLSQYRSVVSSLPMPTQQQLEQFADFVSSAHSWYKHLPLYPPGCPFQFFLNPAAGMQMIEYSDGSLEVAPRIEKGFHYSWIPTAEYRDRFGYLDYSRSSGTSVSLDKGDGRKLIESDDYAIVFDFKKQKIFYLPEEVVEAGTVFVSGLIHPAGVYYRLWGQVIDEPDIEWPEESGGLEALAKIRNRCRALLADPSQIETPEFEDPNLPWNQYRFKVDLPLYKILEPERLRQRRNIVATMQRVVDLVLPDQP